jgi:large subunit ribosomal protein L24
MLKIKRDDIVKAITGKDKGKTGKVLMVIPKENRVLVEGINFIKRHTRQARQDQKGGIIQKESPIHISNLVLVCKHCNRSTKAGIKIMDDSSKVRVCKKCEEIIA